MPYKDPAKKREYDRRTAKARRNSHRPLSTAEIEDRLRTLGLATDQEPILLSLDDPAVRREAELHGVRVA